MMPAFALTAKQQEALCLIANGNAFENMLYGGSRSAKTFLNIYILIVRACKVKSRHLVVRLHFSLLNQSVIHDTFPKVLGLAFPNLAPRVNLRQRPCFAAFPNGSEIWFSGLDDKDRSENVLGNEYSTIFFNEASQINYSSYTLALGRLAQKNDLRKYALLDENPPSKGHWTYKKFIEHVEPKDKQPINPNSVFSIQMNPVDNVDSYGNSHLDKEYLSFLEALPSADRNRFLHGQFNDTVEGGVYTRELLYASVTGRLGDLQPVPMIPVVAVFDIGMSDYTSIWICQFLKEKILFLDFYQNNRMSLPEYLNAIKDKGWNISRLYLPHDARNKSWATGRSIREVAQDYGKSCGFKVEVLPRLSLYDGINASRVVFDKCCFNNIKCAEGLDMLRQYKTSFNDATGVYSDKPDHDLASHAADAFRYVCMAYDDGLYDKPRDNQATFDEIAPEYKLTIKDIMERFESKNAEYNRDMF